MRDKGKAAEGASKRKRTMTNGGGPAHSRRRTATQEPDEDSVSEQYDPDQSIEQRREVQQGLRDLLKNLKENGDEFLQADSEGLHDTLRRADALSANVKQTTEATIDSKLLVNTVDASYRKTMRLTAGNIAQGMDVDEFVSKCITYMRIGGGIADDDAPDLSSTQRQRRRPNRSALAAVDEEDDEENGDAGDPFNWEHIGRFAGCTQARRPATPGFLLGPLSVEKKTRKVVKRSAPFRPGNLQEVRPEVLNPDDIQKNENGDLAGICKTVLERLVKVQQTAQDEAETAFEANDDEMTARIMQEYGLKQTGGIDLLRFVVNPKSFGQTVENMFYVSFLIRDAKIKLEYDDDGFATLGKCLLLYLIYLLVMSIDILQCQSIQNKSNRTLVGKLPGRDTKQFFISIWTYGGISSKFTT